MPTEMEMRHRDFLKSFAIFKNFHPNELLLLSQHLVERRFEPNDVIFQEGDPGESAFFIVFGTVAVLKKVGQERFEPLTTLKSGQMFGQVSLIDGGKRSATCVSTAKTLMLELQKAQFDEMFDMQASFAFRFQEYLTRVMVQQVRQANEKVAKLVRIARSREPDLEMEKVFDTMQDAIRSVKEMGVNLDEVGFKVPEGQRRPELNAQRERMTEVEKRATPRTTIHAGHPISAQPRAAAPAPAPAKAPTMGVGDLPSLNDAPPPKPMTPPTHVAKPKGGLENFELRGFVAEENPDGTYTLKKK